MRAEQKLPLSRHQSVPRFPPPFIYKCLNACVYMGGKVQVNMLCLNVCGRVSGDRCGRQKFPTTLIRVFVCGGNGGRLGEKQGERVMEVCLLGLNVCAALSLMSAIKHTAAT